MKTLILTTVLSVLLLPVFSQVEPVKSNLILIRTDKDVLSDQLSSVSSLLKNEGYRIDKRKSDNTTLVTKPKRMNNKKSEVQYIIEIACRDKSLEARCRILDNSLSDSWIPASSIGPEESSRYGGWMILDKLARTLGTSFNGRLEYKREPEAPSSWFDQLYLSRNGREYGKDELSISSYFA